MKCKILIALAIMLVCSSCENQDNSIQDNGYLFFKEASNFDLYNELIANYRYDLNLEEIENFKKFKNYVDDNMYLNGFEERNLSSYDEYLNIVSNEDYIITKLNFSENLKKSIFNLINDEKYDVTYLNDNEISILNQIKYMNDRDHDYSKWSKRKRTILFTYGLQFNLNTAYTYSGFYELSNN